MKKVVMLVLVLVMVGAVALAEVDLSGMTFDELVELRKQVDQAIWASDGWQSVQVPGGDYDVGVDIPAGRWTLTGVTSFSYFQVYKSRDLKDDIFAEIASESLEQNERYNVTLEDGQYVELSETIEFQPYLGAGLQFR